MANETTNIIRIHSKGMGPMALKVGDYDEAMKKARWEAHYVNQAGGYVTVEVVSEGETHIFWDSRFDA